MKLNIDTNNKLRFMNKPLNSLCRFLAPYLNMMVQLFMSYILLMININSSSLRNILLRSTLLRLLEQLINLFLISPFWAISSRVRVVAGV
ncbi:hypothetical protein HanIR_Chr15g0773081 [Helianthus annuus]|nr:hypothetical protein HanIR_Chr15g0773081 [Helianthus annuus]